MTVPKLEIPDFKRPDPTEYTDGISAFFTCLEGSCNNDLNGDTPRIEMINPLNPLGGRNMEYRNNWEITSVEGIDPLADVALSLETNKTRSGARIKSERKKERKIKITVRICPCDGCDIETERRELYEIIKCAYCAECHVCCNAYDTPGEICLSDYLVKDFRYCIMRVRCCNVVRDISVKHNGKMTIKREGQCEFYTFEFLAPNPLMYFPKVQTYEFELADNPDAVFCPAEVCLTDINVNQIQSFRHCFNLPYTGTEIGWPKITIVGSVTNLRITNMDTGAVISLNNSETVYRLGGCGATILNFWREQQSYTDAQGNNIYTDLLAGCQNQFNFQPGCDDGINLCIEGDQVDTSNFYIKIQWWLEFDGFWGLDEEPEFIDVGMICTSESTDDEQEEMFKIEVPQPEFKSHTKGEI